jgi:hypothetical protein
MDALLAFSVALALFFVCGIGGRVVVEEIYQFQHPGIDPELVFDENLVLPVLEIMWSYSLLGASCGAGIVLWCCGYKRLAYYVVGACSLLILLVLESFPGIGLVANVFPGVPPPDYRGFALWWSALSIAAIWVDLIGSQIRTRMAAKDAPEFMP